MHTRSPVRAVWDPKWSPCSKTNSDILICEAACACRWDIAAGDAILQALCGKLVQTSDGRAFPYVRTEDVSSEAEFKIAMTAGGMNDPDGKFDLKNPYTNLAGMMAGTKTGVVDVVCEKIQALEASTR